MSTNLEKFYQETDYSKQILEEGLEEYENMDNKYQILDSKYPELYKVLQDEYINNVQVEDREYEIDYLQLHKSRENQNKIEKININEYNIDVLNRIEKAFKDGLLPLLDNILVGEFGDSAKYYLQHHLDMLNKDIAYNTDKSFYYSHKQGLFRVAVKAVVFETPMYYAIQNYWHYSQNDVEYFDQNFLTLTGYHSGVNIYDIIDDNVRVKKNIEDSRHINIVHLGIYKNLSEEYNNLFLQIKEQYPDKDLTFWIDKTMYKFTNLLITASEFHDPQRPTGSSYREDLKTTFDFAKLGKGVRKRLQGIKRKIHKEIDLHNIGRFIGKSGANRFDRQKDWVDKEMKFVNSYPKLNEEKVEKLKSEEKFDDLKKYKSYIKMRQEEYNYLQAPDQWEKNLLEKIEKKFHKVVSDEYDQKLYEDKKQEALAQIKNMRRKKQDIYKGYNLEEYKSFIFDEKEKVYRKWHNNKSLADKALDLYFQTDIKEIIDPINDLSFGTINRLYGFWIDGMRGQELIAYLLTELLSDDHSIDRDRYNHVLNHYNFYKKTIEYDYPLDDICHFTQAEAKLILNCNINFFIQVLPYFKNLNVKLFWETFDKINKSHYYIDETIKQSFLSNANNSFDLDDEVSFFVNRGLLFDNNLERMRTEYFLVKDKSIDEQNKAIANIIKRDLSPDIKQNFENFVEWFGFDFLFEIKKRNEGESWHDSLLFVSHLRNKKIIELFPKDKIKKIIEEAPTALDLDEVFNQFSKSLWEEGLEHLQGKSYDYDYDRLYSYDVRGYVELKKIINILSLSAILPEGLDIDVIEQVQIMVGAPGVNFDAIKYDLENGRIEELLFNQELDKEALIQPLEKVYPLENVNNLLKDYLQNQKKLKLAPLLGKLIKKEHTKLELDDEVINFNLFNKIRQIDKNTKNKIKQKYAQQISRIYEDDSLDEKTKDKSKLKLREQENKEKNRKLILPNKKTLKLKNFKIFDKSELETYFVYIQQILSNDKYKKLRKHLVDKDYPVDEILNSDIETCENYTLIIEKIIKEMLEIGIQGAQAGNQAKKLYADLRQFLYKSHKGASVNDYLNNNIPEKDKEYIYDLMDKYKIMSKNKRLVARIHKQSDPRAWVCGDYTHCCMRYGTDKNYDYMENQNTSYFTISYETDTEEANNIIAQSVLVAAADKYDDEQEYLSKEKDFPVLAIDNIEIANNALKFRKQIAQIYHDIFDNKFEDKKIIMGTSNNDDGGLVSGDLSQEIVNYKSLQNLVYTDCFDNNTCYVFREAQGEEKEEVYKLKGLASYLLESETDLRSELIDYLGDAKLGDLKKKLLKYNNGEDDGDGGLLFPHNYSRILEYQDKKIGYILAGEFIEDPDELEYTGVVEVEEFKFFEDVDLIKFLDKWFAQMIAVEEIKIPSYLVDKKLEKYLLASDYIKKNYKLNINNKNYILTSKNY